MSSLSRDIYSDRPKNNIIIKFSMFNTCVIIFYNKDQVV